MTPEPTLNDLHFAYFSAWKRIAEAVGQCSPVPRVFGAHSVKLPIPIPAFNPVFVLNAPDVSDTGWVERLYLEVDTGSVLRTISSVLMSLFETSSRFKLLSRAPAMHLDLTSAFPASVARLHIIRVSRVEELREVNSIVSEAFGTPRHMLTGFDSKSLLEVAGLEFYLGLAEEIPVCTATICAGTSDIACLLNVGTLKRARNRGYAECIVREIGLIRRQHGLKFLALESTSDSVHLYGRIGFQSAGDFLSWSKEESSHV